MRGPARLCANKSATDEHSGYLDEAGRLGFSHTEMARQLRPILDRMKKGEGA